MGRHLQRVDSDIEFQKYHSGCLWGNILHFLDYYHRSNVKRILPRRKHGQGKKIICCRNPKTHSLDHYTDQVHEYLNADAVPLMVEKETKVNAVNITSGEAQMKPLIAKEMSGRLGLQAVELSHHLGSSNHDPSPVKAAWTSPIIILQRTADPDSTKLHSQSPRAKVQHTYSDEKSDKSVTHQSPVQRLNRETSSSQLEDSEDVLEIFKVNKKLFLEVLHDSEVQATKPFHIQQNSIQKLNLKKSGSFPAVGSSCMRSLRPVTLEHKQKEIWSFPKVENSTAAVQSLEYLASKSAENSFHKSNDVKVDISKIAAITQEPIFPSPALSEGLNKNGRHSSVMGYLTDIKMMIKHALMHSKKGSERNIIGGIFVGVSSELKCSNDEKEITSHEDDGEKPGRLLEMDGPGNDLGKDGLRHVRRASSLKESLDKYTLLFEHNFSREAPRHQFHSRSLRLTSEDKNLSRMSSLKTFRRRLSMPDLDYFSPFPDEASNDDLKPQMAIRATALNEKDVSSEIQNDLEPVSINVSREKVESTECEKDIVVGVEGSGVNEDSMTGFQESTVETVELHEEVVETHIEEDENRSPVSVLKAHFQDEVSRPMEFPVCQGSGLEPSSIFAKESDGSAGIQDRSDEDPSAGFNLETAARATTIVDNHFHNSKLRRPDDPDFDYVRDVLDISGFLEQECLATWHSVDQPLSPKLFKEWEAYLPLEQIYSTKDITSYNDHHLLFDMVNEALLEVFESALAYFPKQSSFTQRIRPVPKGNRVLEEVWNRISWHRSSGSKMDQSLDNIAERDLAKCGGWMNLQLDAEDVALDLEDIIFDELIGEAIYD